MQIRLLTTINYGNIGAYSDKMLHTPEPCTRPHAGLLQEGTAEASGEGQEDRGGYFSASSGAFQEECNGAWGGLGVGTGD